MLCRRLQRLCLYAVAGAGLLVASPEAQEPPASEELGDEELLEEVTEASDVEVIPPQEPMTPREELFLAIELRDVQAARQALDKGAGREIASGDPSPLATAALVDDLRMVALLLDAGGDPSAAPDSPLEEAIRNENARMVELFMRSGARVPAGAAGQELFRLAQRGSAAMELSRILLDHGADAGQCLAAATDQARAELMKYCLRRGADAAGLPAEMNVLGVALASGDPEIVEQILDGDPSDSMLADAFTDAIAAGRTDLVEQALAAGAKPAFEHLEAAVESGQPEIGLLLLDRDAAADDSTLLGGDIEALVQRASDLGLSGLAGAVRRKSGLHAWYLAGWLPLVLGGLVVAGLGLLAVRGLARGGGRSSPAPRRRRSRPGGVAATPNAAPERSVLAADPRPTEAVAAAPAAAASIAPAEPRIDAPAAIEANPAATLPVGAIPSIPSTAPSPPEPAPAPLAAAGSPAAAAQGSRVWHFAPEPVAEVESDATSEPVAVAASPAAIDLRMPEVDLGRDVEAVFASARAASSGETVRPDAPDRRQVVLVTPSRVTMLQSCAAPGSVAPEQLAAAERLAGASPAKNVAVIAYTDLDAMTDDITHTIPFFDLLRDLGYLGHAVWIFEGHVSAMAAGCRDADVLIVDDGMMPYLPGNWRSVATRVMRGSDIRLYQRKTGALRRLA